MGRLMLNSRCYTGAENALMLNSINYSSSGGSPVAVTQFRYIKWHITANGGAGYFQVSELGFCDTADNIMAFPQGMSATSSLSLLSDYSISNLFDGSTNTKIVTEWHSGDIEDITIDFGSGNEIDITEYPYYYWGSSDDDQTYVGRAPLKWQLLGANQSDFSDAVLLDEVTSFSPLVKNKEMAYRGLMVSPIQSGGGIDYIESWIITNTTTTMSTHIEYNNGKISSYAVYSQAGNTTQTEGDIQIRIGSDTNWKWRVTATNNMTYKIYDVANSTLSELRTATNGTVILSNIEISGNITYEIRRYS